MPSSAEPLGRVEPACALIVHMPSSQVIPFFSRRDLVSCAAVVPTGTLTSVLPTQEESRPSVSGPITLAVAVTLALSASPGVCPHAEKNQVTSSPGCRLTASAATSEALPLTNSCQNLPVAAS